MKLVSQLVSLLLAALLAASPLPAQSPMPTVAAPIELQILHRHDDRAGNALSVQIVDEAGKPVADAVVVFRLTGSDFRGKFADGTTTATVQTDATGSARVDGLRGYDDASATAAVQVTATKGSAHAGTLFSQALAIPSSVPTTHNAAAGNPSPLPGTSRSLPGQVAATPTPGVVVENQSATARRSTYEDDSLDANVPVRHMFGPEASESSAAGVSVVNGSKYSAHEGHSKAKWIIGIAAAAGAGAAFAMLHKGSGASSSSSSGISIGAPTVSVGHP